MRNDFVFVNGEIFESMSSYDRLSYVDFQNAKVWGSENVFGLSSSEFGVRKLTADGAYYYYENEAA